MFHCTKHGDHQTYSCLECQREEAAEKRNRELIEAEREEAERVIEAQAEAQAETEKRIIESQKAAAQEMAETTRRQFAANLARQREMLVDGWRIQAAAKVHQAQELFLSDMLHESAALYRAAVSEDPGNFLGQAGFAKTLFSMGDRDEGKRHMVAAIRLLGTKEAGSYEDFLSALIALPEDDMELAREFFEKFAVRCCRPEQLDAETFLGFVIVLVAKDFHAEARRFIDCHTTVAPAINDSGFGRLLATLHEEDMTAEAQAIVRSAGKPSTDGYGASTFLHLREIEEAGGGGIVQQYLERAFALSSPVSCPVFWTCLVLFQREIEGRAQLSEQWMQEAASWNLDKQDIWLAAVSGVWKELTEDFPKDSIQWLQEALCKLRHQWVAARNARLDQLAHQNVTVAPPGGPASFGIGCGLFIALIFIASSIAVVLSKFGADQRSWMQLTTFGAPVGAIVGTLLIRWFVKSSKERKLIDANRASLQAAEDRKWPQSV